MEVLSRPPRPNQGQKVRRDASVEAAFNDIKMINNIAREMARAPSLSVLQRKGPTSLNANKRRKELQRIDAENERLLKRLEGAKPTLAKREWQRSYDESRKHVALACIHQENLPPVPGPPPRRYSATPLGRHGGITPRSESPSVLRGSGTEDDNDEDDEYRDDGENESLRPLQRSVSVDVHLGGQNSVVHIPKYRLPMMSHPSRPPRPRMPMLKQPESEQPQQRRALPLPSQKQEQPHRSPLSSPRDGSGSGSDRVKLPSLPPVPAKPRMPRLDEEAAGKGRSVSSSPAPRTSASSRNRAPQRSRSAASTPKSMAMSPPTGRIEESARARHAAPVAWSEASPARPRERSTKAESPADKLAARKGRPPALPGAAASSDSAIVVPKADGRTIPASDADDDDGFEDDAPRPETVDSEVLAGAGVVASEFEVDASLEHRVASAATSDQTVDMGPRPSTVDTEILMQTGNIQGQQPGHDDEEEEYGVDPEFYEDDDFEDESVSDACRTTMKSTMKSTGGTRIKVPLEEDEDDLSGETHHTQPTQEPLSPDRPWDAENAREADESFGKGPGIEPPIKYEELAEASQTSLSRTYRDCDDFASVHSSDADD